MDIPTRAELEPVPNLFFVEYEIDQPGPPLSWFVRATKDQAAEILAFLTDHLEPWQNPWVGPVVPYPYEQLMIDLKDSIDPEFEEDDETAADAGPDNTAAGHEHWGD